MGLGSTLVASFLLYYFFKGTLPKYSRILRQWGLELQHINFGGGKQFNPEQKNYLTNQWKIKSWEVEEIQ